MDEPEHTYEMVVPFVVCASQGGPYDDEAFVAGCNYATVASELKTRELETHQRYMSPKLVPQLDLLAMQHGYRVEHEPWDEHPDEWTLVTFTRQPRE